MVVVHGCDPGMGRQTQEEPWGSLASYLAEAVSFRAVDTKFQKKWYTVLEEQGQRLSSGFTHT